MPRRPSGRHDDDDHRDDFDDDPDDGYDYKHQPKLKKKQDAGDEEIIEKVVIAPEFHRFIVRERQRIEQEFDCVLDIPSARPDDKIYIMGARRNAVACAAQIAAIVARETAKAAVTQETATFVALPGQEMSTIAVELDRSSIGLFIGKGGSRLADLRARLRGQGGREFIAEVLVPDRSDTSQIVTVKVPRFAADRALSIIKSFSEFYELGALKVTVVNSDAAAVMTVDASDRDRGRRSKPASPAAAPVAAAAAAAAAKSPAAAAAAGPVVSAADSAAAPAAPAASATAQQRHKRVFPAFKEMSPDKFPHAVLECRFDD